MRRQPCSQVRFDKDVAAFYFAHAGTAEETVDTACAGASFCHAGAAAAVVDFAPFSGRMDSAAGEPRIIYTAGGLGRGFRRNWRDGLRVRGRGLTACIPRDEDDPIVHRWRVYETKKARGPSTTGFLF